MRFQVHLKLDVIEGCRVGAVVGSAHLRYDLLDFGKRLQSPTHLVRQMRGVAERDILREGGANPEISLLELRHEFAANYPKEGQRGQQEDNSNGNHKLAVPHPANEQSLVAVLQPTHQTSVGRVASTNRMAVRRQHRRKQQSENQGAG